MASRLVLAGHLLAGLPGERRGPGQGRRPPGVRGDVLDQRAERVGVGREQQHLGYGRQFRPEALLHRLLPHRGEVRRQRHVGEEVGIGGLERGDHRGVVRGPVGVGRGHLERVARRLGDRREHRAERVAVRVVGERGRDHLVRVELGTDPVPHRDEGLNQMLGAQEVHHHVLRLERGLLRVAPEVDVPGLPRDVRADQRRTERFGLAGHRVDGLRRGRRQQQVHAVAQDGRPGQISGPGRAGLGVVGLDGDRVGLAGDLEPVLVRGGLLNLGDHPVVRCAEPGEGTGQRVDPADRDGLGAARPGPGP